MNKKSATKDEKVRLLKAAVKKHQQLASAAARGEGVDRPVIGSLLICSSSMSIDFGLPLGCLLAQPPSMPEPELFTDSFFARSIDGTLFTTCVFSSHIRQYGWGEYNDDGFGIAYMTGSNGVFHLFVLFFIATYSREDVVDYRLLTVHDHLCR